MKNACILAALCLASSLFAAAAPPPNIVLIITDDQGYPELSAHGNPVLKTPNLDRLHRESVRFTRFQVEPTCAPTRSAIMSGRPPFYVGVTHTILERERMALGVPTLPEALRGAGYATCMTGKWHLGDEEPYRPRRRGFDEVFQHGAGGIGQSYPGTCGDAPGNSYFGPWVLHNGTFVKTEGYCTDEFFGHARKWIKRQVDRKKRFFAYISTNAPHGPLHVAEKYSQPFIDAGQAEDTAKYYGMIVNIDENVGALLADLEELGVERDTLVIFMTDNGDTRPGNKVFNAGMKGGKGSVDEGGTRVPCFFRWPGTLAAGVDVDRLAAHIDLLPTLCEIAGAEPKEADKLHGRSLVPLLKDAKAPWEDRMLVSHKGRWKVGSDPNASKNKDFSVRSQRWRFVGPGKLYDMEADPGQKTDVAAQHPEVVKAHLAFYNQWWKGALPNLVNEKALRSVPNPFHVLFHEQQDGPKPVAKPLGRWK